MFHKISLGAVLFAAWLLLSGHFDPLLIGLGIGSCLLVLFISLRMDVIDHEGHPMHLTFRGLGYWPWLLVEIIKSNIDVAGRIIRPSMPISPEIFSVKADQPSELGQVIYANSITLTPGTISIDLANGEILVHALTHEGADAVIEGEMGRRVTRLEDG